VTQRSTRLRRALALGLATLAVTIAALPAAAASNVTWTFADSIAACPAGDSVAAGHPARLRILVTYLGLAIPRAGVPPESIRVEWNPLAGSVRVNDQAGYAFADDSTDAAGRARIVLPSVSGCGTLALTLRVAGEAVGAFSATIRGTDSDLDGGTTNADVACDLNYDGVADGADAALAAAHAAHSHRNALFGALVRRTNLCETCDEYVAGAIGESTLGWSPDGARIAFTVHTEPIGDCTVFLVPSDPAGGDDLVQFSFPALGSHDYDPSWSPLGTEIAFGRDDNTIWVKGVPGVNPDTSLRLVTRHNDGEVLARGDLTPAISPDGVWVAFTRKSTPEGHYELWKTPVNGDTTQRMRVTTEASGDDFYPQWSNDGEWLVFDQVSGGVHSVWRVSSAGGVPVLVLHAGGGRMASTPAFSPDAAVILAGVGPASGATAHTLDAALSLLTLPDARAVGNFADFALADASPVLTPRLSPDGTRLALRTSQIHAARRNMSLPPRITSVARVPIAHATPFVDLAAAVGAPLAFTIAVADPEGDVVSLEAFFLHDGMSFDAGTRTFSWIPPAGALGTTSNVRFQAGTPSGGSDYAIARIRVVGPLAVPSPARATEWTLGPSLPNPFADRTTLRLDLTVAAPVNVAVFDLAGRCMRVLADGDRAAGSYALTWDGRDDLDRATAPGLYFCRVGVGGQQVIRKVLRIP
jgi:WD40-like Beta Propeller Repeat